MGVRTTTSTHPLSIIAVFVPFLFRKRLQYNRGPGRIDGGCSTAWLGADGRSGLHVVRFEANYDTRCGRITDSAAPTPTSTEYATGRIDFVMLRGLTPIQGWVTDTGASDHPIVFVEVQTDL
jgi:hypothetical protein